MLENDHKHLVEVLLNLNWTSKSLEVISCFKKFIDDLMCVHNYHYKLIFDKLINQFILSKF